MYDETDLFVAILTLEVLATSTKRCDDLERWRVAARARAATLDKSHAPHATFSFSFSVTGRISHGQPRLVHTCYLMSQSTSDDG
eukprot:4230120-Pleurochrysis_carterae.AAC.2